MMATKKIVTGPRPVAWFEVVGKDGKHLRSFYTELFGWHTTDVAPGADYGITEATEHGVGGGIGQSQDGGRGHVTFFVEVDDLDEALRQAESLGGKMITKPMTFPDKRPSSGSRGSVSFAYFADPEGHIVGICKGIVRP